MSLLLAPCDENEKQTKERGLFKAALAGPPRRPCSARPRPMQGRKSGVFLLFLVASGCLSREYGTRGGPFTLPLLGKAQSNTPECTMTSPFALCPPPCCLCKHFPRGLSSSPRFAGTFPAGEGKRTAELSRIEI